MDPLQASYADIIFTAAAALWMCSYAYRSLSATFGARQAGE